MNVTKYCCPFQNANVDFLARLTTTYGIEASRIVSVKVLFEPSVRKEDIMDNEELDSTETKATEAKADPTMVEA